MRIYWNVFEFIEVYRYVNVARFARNVIKWDFFNNFQTLWFQFLACRLLLRKSTLKTINYLDEKSALQKNLGKNLQKKKKIQSAAQKQIEN